MSATTIIYILAGIFLALAAKPIRAQDTLVTINGDILPVKLQEIGSKSIIYSTGNTSDSAVATVDFTDVFIIKYSNGKKVTYTEHLAKSDAAPTHMYTSAQLKQLGTRDAQQFVNTKRRSLAIGALSLANPPAGLVVALTTTNTAPPDKKTTSNPALLSEPDYVTAYRKEGRKIKKRKGIRGFLFGCGTYVLLVGMLVSAE